MHPHQEHIYQNHTQLIQLDYFLLVPTIPLEMSRYYHFVVFTISLGISRYHHFMVFTISHHHFMVFTISLKMSRQVGWLKTLKPRLVGLLQELNQHARNAVAKPIMTCLQRNSKIYNVWYIVRGSSDIIFYNG